MYKLDAIEEFGTRWFLLKTNVGKERVAVGQVERLADDVLLPLMQGRVRRWNTLVPTVSPLCPGYLFARCHFERPDGQVRYTR
ncbi:MAG: transcription termination/antitermination NusG family protein, partial [Candidatus Binataceae bacterium]